MGTVDFIILVMLGGFVLAGLWFGAIHMVGSVLGIVFGAIAAGRYYEPVGQWLANFMGGNVNAGRIVAIFLIYVLANRLFGLLVYIIDKIFKFISVIPFMKTFNRLLGALFGLIEGTFVIGLAVWLMARLQFSEQVTVALRSSLLAKQVIVVGSLLAPLLPKALQALKAAF